MTAAKDGRTDYAGYDRPHRDLREWLERAEKLGEVLRVEGVDWNLEMGSVAEMICSRRSPATLKASACCRAPPTRHAASR